MTGWSGPLPGARPELAKGGEEGGPSVDAAGVGRRAGGLAAALAAAVPGATLSQADGAKAGTVQLIIGADFNGVGQAVTATPATPTPQGEGTRTAADTSCIN